MTTSEPDPRTDLAGWLGLAPAQVSRRLSGLEADTVAAAVGRRLIEQDQADTPYSEPDEGCAACGGTDHGHTDCLVAHTAAAQLRQLDRIKAAYEAVKDEHLAGARPFRADCSNAKCAHLVASLIDELDALEVPDA